MNSEFHDGDPASRFYRRSFEKKVEAGIADSLTAAVQITAGNQRYSTAHAFLSANPGKRVLEMGYGGNGIIDQLAPLAADYHIVDIVDRTSGKAQADNVTVHKANLDNRFPFDDASFDVVLAMMVIEHMYDPFHAFSEIARVARPGADLFVNLPNIASIRCRLQLLAGKMPVTSGADWFENGEWDGSHLHYFTSSDVKRLASINGLATLALHPVGKAIALKRLWPSLLCHEITYHFRKPASG